jgi:hypothetical protein
MLGAISPPQDPDAELFALDSEYLPLRITTSWIGGPSSGGTNGAVLAFFHATEGQYSCQWIIWSWTDEMGRR